MDIGNTNIKIAVFKGAEMVHYWRLSTTRKYTSDEMGIMITQLFHHEGIDRRDITGIMLSSVVPTINFTIEHMCKDYFGMEPRFLVPGLKTGLNIRSIIFL